MKALSFLQPWAFACLYLGKRIDNRSRKDGRRPAVCEHRGPMLIHASLRPSKRYFLDAEAWMRAELFGNANDRLLPRWETCGYDERMSVGGIVGRCIVTGHVCPDGAVFHDSSVFPFKPGYEPIVEGKPLDKRWHMGGSYGLILSNVAALPFFPLKGQLGLFEVPADVAMGSAIPSLFRPPCPVCDGQRVRPSDTNEACRNCFGSGHSPTVEEAIARHHRGSADARR